ncbi:Magnetosome protein MamH [Azospirillaceae bacterium]|nr:magnetosome protein MamH [uncultured bacterium]
MGIDRQSWNALYLIAAIAMIFMTLAVAVQPLFLRNILGIAFDTAGTINANVQVVTEVLALAVTGYLGFLSDRFGRVPIMVGGFLVGAAGGLLAPFSLPLGTLFGIGGIAFYYLARIVMSFGTSAVWPQLATLAGDFTDYDNRALQMSKAAFMMAFGSTLVFAVLMQMTKHTGIIAVMLFNAVIGLIGAWLASHLLCDVAPKQADQKIPWQRIKELLIREPRLRVAFAASLFSRSDIILIGLFYMLWTIYFADLVGKTQAEAAAHAGKMIGIVGLLVMVTILVWGRFVQRFGRIPAIIAGMAISATGFLAMGFAVNPFDWYVYLPMALIALGQSGTLLAPEILACDLTPEDIRGSVLGVLNVIGGIGLIVILQVGGALFDAVGPYAPFVFTGIGNLLVLIYALYTSRFEGRGQGAAAREQQDEIPSAVGLSGG